MKKETPGGAFIAPDLLRSYETRGWRIFPIKQHDYGGSVLADNAITRTEGIPLLGYVPSPSSEQCGGSATDAPCHVKQEQRGEPVTPSNEQRRPWQCTGPGRGVGQGSFKEDPRETTVLTQSAGSPPDKQAPLAGRRPALSAIFTLEAAHLFPPARPRLASGPHVQAGAS